jgi:ribose transport system permease protein
MAEQLSAPPVDRLEAGTTAATPGGTGSRPAKLLRYLNRLDRLVLPASFVVMVVIFATAKPDAFLTTENLRAILDQAVILAVLATGLTLVLSSGDFDLSFNSTVGLAGSAAVFFMSKHHLGVVGAILIAIGVGALVGALNGWLVAYLGGDAFIITLGIGTAVGGIEQSFTKGDTIYAGISPAYNNLATTSVIGKLSLFVFVSFAVVLLAWMLSEGTSWGRSIHAVGSNRAAALNAGINVKRKRFSAFVLMGICAGIAGVIITARARSSFPNAGAGLLIGPYTAAFLGAALTRRRFHPAMTYLGVIYMGVLATGLTMTDQETWVINVVTGAVLAVAVVLSGQTLARPRWMDRVLPRRTTPAAEGAQGTDSTPASGT